MKRTMRLICGVVVAVLWGLVAGCDWEDASDYNTSQGAGTSVNFSGTYYPTAGSVLVGTNISSLVLLQIGNALQVYDVNASYYSGSVGSPGTQFQPNADGVYAAGATLLQCQVNFTGVNEASGKDVTFVGTVRAVAVNEIKGQSSTTSVTSTDTQGGETVTVTITTTTSYTITEANTRYVLEGYWYEEGGTVSIDAYCRSASGTITTTETDTTTTTP